MKQLNSKIIFQGAIILGSTILVAYAQDKKGVDKTVIITHGDTLGKGMRISNFDKHSKGVSNGLQHQCENVTIRRLPEHDVLIAQVERPIVKRYHGDPLIVATNDSTLTRMRRRPDLDRRRLPDDISISIPNVLQGFRDDFFIHPARPVYSERPDSQSFDYAFTDRDGISNKMSIQIQEAEAAEIREVVGDKGDASTISVADLLLFPNYSLGKMTLSFLLPAKGNVAVRILNSDFQPVFSHQQSLSGTYMQQLNMLQNGIYFIHIKQGGASYVKKIFKE
jgi:hypothetical protein